MWSTLSLFLLCVTSMQKLIKLINKSSILTSLLRYNFLVWQLKTDACFFKPRTLSHLTTETCFVPIFGEYFRWKWMFFANFVVHAKTYKTEVALFKLPFEPNEKWTSYNFALFFSFFSCNFLSTTKCRFFLRLWKNITFSFPFEICLRDKN